MDAPYRAFTTEGFSIEEIPHGRDPHGRESRWKGSRYKGVPLEEFTMKIVHQEGGSLWMGFTMESYGGSLSAKAIKSFSLVSRQTPEE